MPGEQVIASPGSRSSLRSAVVGGLAWKGASQVVLQILRLVLAISLARLLSPEEVGIAAMVIVFATFIVPFADLGLGAALVQRPKVTPVDVSTVFWASLGAGASFTLLGLVAAHPLSAFYGEADVAPLFMVLSFAFVITSLSATHRSLLVRELRFRDLETRLVVSYALGVPAAIVVAATTHSAWAFVTFELVAASVSTLLLWLMMRWRPTFAFSRSTFRNFGVFGIQVLGSRLFLDLSQIVDKLVVGRWLGAAPLGVYALGSSVVLGPMARVAAPIQEVLFPAFSRVQGNNEQIRDAWLRSVRLLATVVAPAMLGMIVVAGDFVPVLLGDRWADAVPVVRLLAVAGMVVALQSMSSIVLQAIDRPRQAMALAALSLASAVSAIAIGLRWGVTGVAAAYAIQAVLVTPAYVFVSTRRLGVAPFSVVRAVAGPASGRGTDGRTRSWRARCTT